MSSSSSKVRKQKKDPNLEIFPSAGTGLMEAFNALLFLLRHKRQDPGLEIVEYDEVERRFGARYKIVFLTNRDFEKVGTTRRAANPGSPERKMYRPDDKEKKTALVDTSNCYWTKVGVYLGEQLFFEDVVSNFSAEQERRII